MTNYKLDEFMTELHISNFKLLRITNCILSLGLLFNRLTLYIAIRL